MSTIFKATGARSPLTEADNVESIMVTDRSLWGGLPADVKAEILAEMARKAVKPIPDTDDQTGSDS